MAGLGKKKQQRKAKQAAKRATKTENESTPSSSSDNVITLPPDEWFAALKDKVLDCEPFGSVMDGFLRNTVRMTVELHAPRFGALPFLLGKNLVYTQSCLEPMNMFDRLRDVKFMQVSYSKPNRVIQGKLYMTGSKVDPNAADVIPCSRKLFEDSVPYLLKNTDQWFFSRSLVFKGYKGVIDEAVKFPSYDPVGSLLAFPQVTSGIRCAEVFLFVAGDFDVEEDGLCSREAVKELLNELNTEKGITKLLCFDIVAASVTITKEKLAEIKDVHLSLTA